MVENLNNREYINITGATNAENNGRFKVTDILSDTKIQIENLLINDSSKDEATTSAIIEKVYQRFEVEDIMNQDFGEHENHYKLVLNNKNT